MNRHNEDIRYVINEEKRTVVAILTIPQTEIVDEIANIMNNNANRFFQVTEMITSPAMLLTGIYRGIAYAHPEDEWDVEEGKKRARLRARRTYMKERKRIIKALEDVFDDIEDNVERAVKFTKNVLKRIDADMDTMDDTDDDKKSEKDDD